MHEAVARNVAYICLVVATSVHSHAKKGHVSRAVSCLKRRDVSVDASKRDCNVGKLGCRVKSIYEQVCSPVRCSAKEASMLG